MYQLIIVIHILLGLGVIGLVLMQQGKGADAGASFGSGSSGSVFGAQGAASFLSRSTAVLATLFFCTSLGLAIINGHKTATADIMSTPAVKKDVPALPEVDGAKSTNNAVAIPDVKTPVAPVAPAMITPPVSAPAPVAAPASDVKVENAVVKPAEIIEEKPAELKQPVAQSEVSKPVEAKAVAKPVETKKPIEKAKAVKDNSHTEKKPAAKKKATETKTHAKEDKKK